MNMNGKLKNINVLFRYFKEDGKQFGKKIFHKQTKMLGSWYTYTHSKNAKKYFFIKCVIHISSTTSDLHQFSHCSWKKKLRTHIWAGAVGGRLIRKMRFFEFSKFLLYKSPILGAPGSAAPAYETWVNLNQLGMLLRFAIV